MLFQEADGTTVVLNNIIPFLAVVAFLGLALNVVGLIRPLRYRHFNRIPPELYRFNREAPLAYNDALGAIRDLADIKDPLQYAQSATVLISKCLAHLEWTKLDPIEAYQTVPFWENPTLWALGRYSGLEYYRRYNFTHYKRTIERGFGICGDASMVLSQLLRKKRIKHEIIAYSGHVLVEAEIAEKKYALDPDFGVATDFSIVELADNLELTKSLYVSAGYPESDGVLIGNILQRKSYSYSSVYHFVPKRFLIERVSYWLFWYVPPITLVWCLTLLF